MGWIERCYETYERNRSEVGVPSTNRFGREAPMLLPVAHTTQKVQVEVGLTGEGQFLSARVLRPDEMTTVIPCTEESAARTSGPVPHPLVDKLQYLAGDYAAFGGTKKLMWEEYLAQLKAWCSSPYALAPVQAVLAYLQRGCLIADLVGDGVLWAGPDGKLLQQWTGPKEELPPIFQAVTGAGQWETFVRFRVGDVPLSSTPAVWDSYTQYYLSTLETVGVCYVQGKEMPTSLLSPYKVRNPGDRAKLISSNDSINFTYRGRFSSVEEALSIGYETTQKAHSALRWLIGRQGVNSGDQTILVWGMADELVPPVTGDSYDLVEGSPGGWAADDPDDVPEFSQPAADTRAAFALRFAKAVQGYRQVLTDASRITVMVLDSATPGRLSIRYYQELSGSRLMDAVEDWHKYFAWEQRYRKIQTEQKGKKTAQTIVFFGAPAPKDIAEAVYGAKVSAKLKEQTVERLLPCITEGRHIPRTMVRMAVARAANSIALEPWEAAKTRSIACALVRGYYHRNKEEEFTMALDETCNDRSYLFGRILACADQLEQYAAYAASDGARRPTNALRMEVAFTQHPARTTDLLRKQLQPYLERLIKANKSTYANDLMLQLLDRIPIEEFNNVPLNELYLLGYASQRAAFFKKQDAAQASNVDEE